MTDLTKMTPLDAIEWYEDQRRALWDVDDLRAVVAAGNTDTDAILTILGFGSLEDPFLDGRIPISVENIRLFERCGERVLVDDPDNASEWYAILGEDGSPDEAAAFLDAGRGPSFARDVIAALDAVDHFNRPTITDLDLTRPLGDLQSMIAADLSEWEAARWAKVGVTDLADVLATRESIEVAVAEAAVAEEIPREEWATYAAVPGSWVERSGARFTRPAAFTLPVLAEFAAAGFGVPTEKDRWAVPWVVLSATITVDQARAAVAGGMSRDDLARFYEASAPGNRWVKGSPPDLRGREDMTVALGKHLDVWVAMYGLGVRASHLTDYRWSGCHTFGQIVDAARAGITPKIVKALRDQYGKGVGYRGDGSKRIDNYLALSEAFKSWQAEHGVTTLPTGEAR